MIVKKPNTSLESQVDREKNQPNKELKLGRNFNFLACFIGTNRTGKSSVCKQMIADWKYNNSGKVVAFDSQDNFGGLVDTYVEFNQKNKTWFNPIIEARNSLIILDDYKLLHPTYTPEYWLTELMNYRAKWNNDIIVITHSPALVLNYLTYYITHYYIFYTKFQQGSFEKKIPDYDLCERATATINDYVKTYGKGNYPFFPHIIVDTQNSKLIAKNIDKDKFDKLTTNKK